MIDFKELAESILTDLMNNVAISDILLKAKIFAAKRGDKELLDWVTRELEGYEDTPPKYRIINSGLKIEVHRPDIGRVRIEFPSEMIEDKDASERLSNMPFHQPIGELENLSKKYDSHDNTVSIHVPVFAYQFLKPYIVGDIQDAYQYTTKAAVSQIVIAIKNVLIDFLLKVGDEENINFNNFIKTKSNMITINAGIVNTGSGDVNAQGSTNVVGDNNIVNTSSKDQLLKILAEIDKIAEPSKPNFDYEELVKEIKDELAKEKPDKSKVKRFFQLIPTFLMGMASSAAGNGLTGLIKSAVALLL